eukprot:6212252-Pleurochrysis_carterae.AAC.5
MKRASPGWQNTRSAPFSRCCKQVQQVRLELKVVRVTRLASVRDTKACTSLVSCGLAHEGQVQNGLAHAQVRAPRSAASSCSQD